MDVDLDDARVRGDGELLQPMVARRLVALDDDRHLQFRGRVLQTQGEVQPVFQVGERRQEAVEPALAGLDAQGGAHQVGVQVIRQGDLRIDPLMGVVGGRQAAVAGGDGARIPALFAQGLGGLGRLIN